ncbi:MAG TPA: tetratricopeptide repeat protein, partial [Longimicrobiales bacterium]|nr:tetratricopeptide repeat protein [Longimicrobiales bacterium]
KFARSLAAIEVPRDRNPSEPSGTVDGPFVAAMRDAIRDLDIGKLAAAQAAAERARDLIPGFAAPNGPYMVLYRIHGASGDSAAAIEALRGQVAHNESDYEAHLTLAGLLAAKGDAAGAADILERAMYIYPYDAGVHTRMAELYATAGQHRKAVRERRAVLALAPVNRADALYRLALALADAGDRDNARREVLRALEIAPNYPDAQDPLLRLRGGDS